MSDETFGPGDLGYEDLSSLPTAPSALASVLRRRAEASGAPTNVQMLLLVGDLLRQPGAPPQLRAALYRVAADIDGIELVGEVTDQAGRRGTAVGIAADDAGARIRTTLVFDPETSGLLAEETVLLDSVPWVDAEPPAVIGYSLYLESGLVGSTSERPAPWPRLFSGCLRDRFTSVESKGFRPTSTQPGMAEEGAAPCKVWPPAGH